MFYEKLRQEANRLNNEIQTITNQLEKLPKGNFYCVQNGKYSKWFLRNEKKNIYIPKKHRKIAEDLAVQKYLSLRLNDLIKNMEAIDTYLAQCVKSNEADKLLEDPAYRELLSSHFTPVSEELTAWMNAPYEKNPNHPENLKHKTASGIYVRSKSEVLIDLALYQNKIPFRYECALYLDHRRFFPDFTIRHPITGTTFYWEHLGLITNPEYAKNAYSKLEVYTAHGIIPSINLIVTVETPDSPLSLDYVEKITEHFFS